MILEPFPDMQIVGGPAALDGPAAIGGPAAMQIGGGGHGGPAAIAPSDMEIGGAGVGKPACCWDQETLDTRSECRVSQNRVLQFLGHKWRVRA